MYKSKTEMKIEVGMEQRQGRVERDGGEREEEVAPLLSANLDSVNAILITFDVTVQQCFNMVVQRYQFPSA